MKYKMYIAGCFVVICFSRSVVKKLMPEGLLAVGSTGDLYVCVGVGV